MKKYLFCMSIVVIFVLTACEPAVVFENPQPKGAPEEKNFATPYQGTYLSESDSSIVIIDSVCIYKRHWFDFTLSRKRIEKDDNVVKSGEFLHLKNIGKNAIYRIKNDTVYASVALEDTLFHLDGSKYILKSHEGHQIMNVKLNEASYQVIVLSLDGKGNLDLMHASRLEDIEKLEKITPTQDISHHDIEQFMINPTRVEFDEIMEQEIVFETYEKFKRINVRIEDLYPF